MLFPAIVALDIFRVDLLSTMNAESTMGFRFASPIADFAISV